MTECAKDGVFLLTADFRDDGVSRKGEGDQKGVAAGFAGSWFSKEFCYGVRTEESSPTESVTETESDEEDYLAGLTRQMAHSFLDGDEDADASPGSNPKVVAGSPQSTLCAMECWSSSSRGSASMRLEEQETQIGYQSRGILGAKMNSNPLPAPIFQQLEFERLKHEQLINQQLSAAWMKQSMSSGCSQPLGLPPSAWPPLQLHQQRQNQHQQQHQPPPPPPPAVGMRAVFLSGSGSKKASTGTGVFLPRSARNITEKPKKPAFSTVLLPAKVVQALNLNLDELNAKSRSTRFLRGYVMDHDVNESVGAAGGVQQRWSRHRRQPAAGITPDVRLPPEWTY